MVYESCERGKDVVKVECMCGKLTSVIQPMNNNLQGKYDIESFGHRRLGMGEKKLFIKPLLSVIITHYYWLPPGIQTLNVVLMNILMSQITISSVSILRDKEALNTILLLSF